VPPEAALDPVQADSAERSIRDGGGADGPLRIPGVRAADAGSAEPANDRDRGVARKLGRRGLVRDDPDRPPYYFPVHADDLDTAGQLVAGTEVPGFDYLGSLAHDRYVRSARLSSRRRAPARSASVGGPSRNRRRRSRVTEAAPRSSTS
jgi:hypothetical protein